MFLHHIGYKWFLPVLNERYLCFRVTPVTVDLHDNCTDIAGRNSGYVLCFLWPFLNVFLLYFMDKLICYRGDGKQTMETSV